MSRQEPRDKGEPAHIQDQGLLSLGDCPGDGNQRPLPTATELCSLSLPTSLESVLSHTEHTSRKSKTEEEGGSVKQNAGEDGSPERDFLGP